MFCILTVENTSKGGCEPHANHTSITTGDRRGGGGSAPGKGACKVGDAPTSRNLPHSPPRSCLSLWEAEVGGVGSGLWTPLGPRLQPPLEPCTGNARTPANAVTQILGGRHFLLRPLGSSHCHGDQLGSWLRGQGREPQSSLIQEAGGEGRGPWISCRDPPGLSKDFRLSLPTHHSLDQHLPRAHPAVHLHPSSFPRWEVGGPRGLSPPRPCLSQ